MPVYNYLCTNEKCLEEEEIFSNKIIHTDDRKCKRCGEHMERVIHTSCFKDSVKGWYYHKEDDTPSMVTPFQLQKARERKNKLNG